MYARRETAVNVIEARGLTKVYDGRAVVRDFAMTVAAGDIYGFVGKKRRWQIDGHEDDLRRRPSDGWRGRTVRKRSSFGGGRGRCGAG